MAIDRLTSYTSPVPPGSSVTGGTSSPAAAASADPVAASATSGKAASPTSTATTATASSTSTSTSTTRASGEQAPTPRFPWLSFLSSRLAAEAAIETHQFESPVLGDNVNHIV